MFDLQRNVSFQCQSENDFQNLIIELNLQDAWIYSLFIYLFTYWLIALFLVV